MTADAADSLPAEELYFLTRRLQRAVYEYLLSLDALPEPPHRRDGANGHAAQDTTLIGAEEVAALGRHAHVKTEVAATAPTSPPRILRIPSRRPPRSSSPPPSRSSSPISHRHRSTRPNPIKPLRRRRPTVSRRDSPSSTPSCPRKSRRTLHPSLLKSSSRRPPRRTRKGSRDGTPSEPDAEAAPAEQPPTRPAFTLFRRTGAAAAKAVKPAPDSDGSTTVEPVGPAANGSAPHPDVAGEDPESFVKPKDGFHLSDLTDFAVVQRSEPVEEAPTDPASAPDTFEALDQPSPDDAPAPVVPDPPNGATTRGWRLRDDDADQAYELDSDNDPGDARFETDPEVVEARLEINDRLRRKRCDEAAALLQRLANDVGGRALAELALDAGDRCRALGKGNAALSCYLAASRADPVHETPLLRTRRHLHRRSRYRPCRLLPRARDAASQVAQ